jgi:hypothetical protein
VRTPRSIFAAALMVVIGAFGVPLAIGADDGFVNTEPASATGSATRGSMVQVTPTLPPPPPLAPGDSLDLPANSGEGRRVVYSKGTMRVWLVEDDGVIFDTYRVSGRLDQPNYGTYRVWSRSENTCSRKRPNVCMRWMVRFAYARSGDNIGFHEIPRENGRPLQTDDQLGQSLSGGCVRQATDDAIVMWNWAQIGTVVVVVP